MNSADNQGRKKVPVNAKQAQIYSQKFKQFKQIFDDQQSKFVSSSEIDYYIVSSKYLKEWTEFYGSNQSQRYQPNSMNQDLMDAGGQLRKGLTEKVDFQIVNERIFDLIKTDQGLIIKRQAIMVGTQKRVPVYLDLIKYLKLSYQDISDIDYKRKYAQNLELKLVEASMQQPISRIGTRIKKCESLGSRYKLRLWKNNVKDYSMEKLYKYIKDKTQRVSVYKFDGVGKLIEQDDATLQQLNLDEGDYFLAQVSDQYSNYFFKLTEQSKCEGCYKYKKLQFICGCKQVAYCSTQCQQKDKRFHIRDCKFAQEQQLNQQIQMNLTPKSALGRVGLSNLGNTCFMNSCLQCLSNTKPLTEYFINKYFEKEVNKDNPLGSKGRLAKNYAKFIKNMWCQSQSTYSPHNLKAAVAKLNPIFSGYSQHDSQQFFSYLADGIHEDLNRVLKKPYVQSVESNNRSDEQVALDSWIAHTQRNQSIIVDLMTGQYKSKVICPTCNLQSITFDPFTTVSLPVPEDPVQQHMKYYVIFNNSQKQALKMNFYYTKAGQKQWLQMATKQLKRNTQDFVFYVLTALENIYGFQTTSKSEIIHKIQTEGKNVFLLELSEEQKNIKQKMELVTKFAKKSFHDKQFENLWFKRPFWFEKQTTTIKDIQIRLLKYLYNVYGQKNGLPVEQYLNKLSNQKPFTLVLKYKKSIERYYGRVETKFDKEILLQDPTMKLADVLEQLKVNLNDCQLDARFTKQSVKLFNFEKLKSFSDETEDKFSKKSSYKNSSQSSVSLDQCFSVFEQKQQLQVGNQWYCPRCKQFRLATKQMTIYKAPQILILHLKRFKNKGILRKEKNEKNVIFPLNLNIQKYVIDTKPMSSYIPQLKKKEKYIEPSFSCEYKNSSPQYELYAISNHYGGLGGGHYTAYAKNQDKWLEFNDSSVHSVSEESIGGSGAYMLFYRRKDSMIIK